MSFARDGLVLGLGGNVGTQEELVDRFRQVRHRLERYFHPGDPCGRQVHVARLYRTAPIGPEQDHYTNTAMMIVLDDVQAEAIASCVAALEREGGRDRARETRWGPRTLDVDVLVWGDRSVTEPLQIPHPRLARRRFALAPLVDLLGADFEIPGVGRAGDALEGVRDQEVEVIASAW